MLQRGLALLLAAFLLLAGPAIAADLAAIPALHARVTDTAGVLTADERNRLEQKLATLERDRGAQLAVLLVNSTRPESIEQFSLRVAEAWKLGRQGVDDGVLLLVAREDRTLRIEVGYGLEGALPDALAKRIISETIVPRFKQGQYFAGIDAGIDAMVAAINREPLPEQTSVIPQQIGSLFENLVPVALVMVVVANGVLRALFGRLLASFLTGAVAGAVIWWITGMLMMAAIAALVVFFFSLLVGSGRINSGGSGFSGGSGSSGGFSGDSGFSGGGGSFGGGGASGSW
jgi:uncharacterized protein